MNENENDNENQNDHDDNDDDDEITVKEINNNFKKIDEKNHLKTKSID